MSDMNQMGLVMTLNEATGQVASVTLYGNEMLDTKAPCMSELWVNGLPLAFRLHLDPNQPADAHGRAPHLKGERWVDHFRARLAAPTVRTVTAIRVVRRKFTAQVWVLRGRRDSPHDNHP